MGAAYAAFGGKGAISAFAVGLDHVVGVGRGDIRASKGYRGKEPLGHRDRREAQGNAVFRVNAAYQVLQAQLGRKASLGRVVGSAQWVLRGTQAQPDKSAR